MNQTWEYHVDPVPNIGGIVTPAQQAEANSRLLNFRASEGWELAAVAGFFYFKRPKQ